MKIVPAVSSSCSKRGDMCYHSLRYPDETSESLGFSKWGNCLGQWLPEGAKCPWPHFLFSHSTSDSWERLGTVYIPPSCVAAGMCSAHLYFLLSIITAISWCVAGWQDGLNQDPWRNFSGLYQGLRHVILCSSSGNAVFLCPTSKEQIQHAVASLSSATACPLGRELSTLLSTEQTLKKIT